MKARLTRLKRGWLHIQNGLMYERYRLHWTPSSRFLDVGERKAISLAKDLQADALIIDEPAGREAAIQQGLRVIGTLRVLYDAAEAGLCQLEEAYDRLQQTTFGSQGG